MSQAATPTLQSSAVLGTTPKPAKRVVATNKITFNDSTISARIDPTLGKSTRAHIRTLHAVG